MIELIPFDVWFHITAHSSVKSLLSLRATCRYLYIVLDERSVWLAAVRDIAGVIPLPSLSHALPVMSSSELRRKAISMTQLDELWNHDKLVPANVECYRLGSDVVGVDMVPGGEGVLKLFEDGALHLYRRSNLVDPLIIVARPHRPSWNFSGTAYMRRSFLPSGGNWVAIMDHYTSIDEQYHTDFRIHYIDMSTSTMRYLTTVTRQSYCHDFQAKGDLLVIAGQEDDKFFVTVKRITVSPDAVQEELIMNLLPDMTGSFSSISILCSHKLLVSTSAGTNIYPIPDLLPVGEDGSVNIASVSPLEIESPKKSIRDVLCSHLDGRVSAYAFADGEDSLCILPPPGQSEANTIWHKLQGSCSRNASRAILCQDYIDLSPIEFRSLTHFTRPGDHAGYTRLGRAGALDPSQSVTISVPGHDGRTRDLAWDEETGRVCVLYTPLDDSSARNMLLIDMM